MKRPRTLQAGDGTDWTSYADLILKCLAGVGAIVAFTIGLHQYERGQSWQRANVVLSLMDSFNNDHEIQVACEMLDWDERAIDLDGTNSLKFRNEMLVTSLRVVPMDIQKTDLNVSADTVFSSEDMAIRDAFDRFFDFFDKLYALRKAGLVKFSDLYYFNYWLEILRDAGKYKKNPEIKKALDSYVKAYHFYGVQELLKEYSENPRTLEIMN